MQNADALLDESGDINISGDFRKNGSVIGGFDAAQDISFTGENVFSPTSTGGTGNHAAIRITPTLNGGGLTGDFHGLEVTSNIYNPITGHVAGLYVQKPSYFGDATSAEAFGIYIENEGNFPNGYVNLFSQGSNSLNILEGSLTVKASTILRSDDADRMPLLIYANSGSQNYPLTEWYGPNGTDRIASVQKEAVIVGPKLRTTDYQYGFAVAPEAYAARSVLYGSLLTSKVTGNGFNVDDVRSVHIMSTERSGSATMTDVIGLSIANHASSPASGMKHNMVSHGSSATNVFEGSISVGFDKTDGAVGDYPVNVDGDINITGDFRKNGAVFGGKAISGYPGYTFASGTVGSDLKFTATVPGAGGNDINITLLHDSNYVQTLVSMVGGHTIQMVLRTSGGVIQATLSEIASAWNNTPFAVDVAQIEIVNVDENSVIANGGSVTLSGGADQAITPTGGELFFDSEALYVGRADGSFGKIIYTEIVSPPL